MSSLQVGLAVAGGLILGGVIAYNTWNARRHEPRQAQPEVPTPAEQLSDRRMLQLQLLTRRNDPAPAETWGQDAARVLGSASDAASARRLQNVLKALLRK